MVLLTTRWGRSLQPFKHRITRRILPIPPAPAVFDQRVIDVGPIGQDHIANGALVLVVTVSLDGDFLPEGEVRSGLLRSQAASLTFLMAVDAVTRPSLWRGGRSRLSLHGRAGLDGPQMTRAGSFGLSTLRALSAPLTGKRAGLSNPICTKTLA